MVTNAIKLSATVSKWIQPNLKDIISSYLGSNYKILMPIADFISPNTVTNIVHGFVAKLPDDLIPDIAHGFVDDAIKNGGFVFGNVIFDTKDLTELKDLLDYNLPKSKTEEYEVITENKK